MRKLTALGIVLRASSRLPASATLPKPELKEAALTLLAKDGINPNRQRKGKSGEIPRTGGK